LTVEFAHLVVWVWWGLKKPPTAVGFWFFEVNSTIGGHKKIHKNKWWVFWWGVLTEMLIMVVILIKLLKKSDISIPRMTSISSFINMFH
jgi:hypothetical protein